MGTIIWGETPQTPLSVYDVGFAHDEGIPPTPPKINSKSHNKLGTQPVLKQLLHSYQKVIKGY